MANTRPSFGGFGNNIQASTDLENLHIDQPIERPSGNFTFGGKSSQSSASQASQASHASPHAPPPHGAYLYEAECECGFIARSNTEFGFNKSWDAHQLKCPSINSQAGSQVGYDMPARKPKGPNFENYHDVEGFASKLPPTEVDISELRRYFCKYGCETKNGARRSFLSKYTFLEHIAREHPRVRIVLESPPDVDGNNEGTRSIVNEMDPYAR